MAKIYSFPKKYRHRGLIIKDNEKYGPEIIENFVENMVQLCIAQVMEQFKQHSIKIDSNIRTESIRDFAMIVESIRSAVYRTFKLEHDIQKYTDEKFKHLNPKE